MLVFGNKRFGIAIRGHQHETCEKIHGENVHSEEASLPTCASIDAMHLSLSGLIFSLKNNQTIWIRFFSFFRIFCILQYSEYSVCSSLRHFVFSFRYYCTV